MSIITYNLMSQPIRANPNHSDPGHSHDHTGHEHSSGPLRWLSAVFHLHGHGDRHGQLAADEAFADNREGIRTVWLALAALMITSLLQVVIVAWSGSVALLAAGAWLGFPILDPIIGLVIGVAILFITRDAVMTMWYRLMDAIEPEYMKQAEAVVTGPYFLRPPVACAP